MPWFTYNLPPTTHTLGAERLLHFYRRPGVGELLLDSLSLFLIDAFLDWLGGAIHQVLGFFEAQAGYFANGFDHVDLVGARRNQNHVELSLLFGCRSSRGPAATTARSDSNRSRRGRHTELFFQDLDELCRLEQRQPLNLFRYCVDVRHCLFFLLPLIVRTCFPSRPDR